MIRVVAERLSEKRAFLSEEEIHHLIVVLRRRQGEEIEVIAPEGRRYRSILRREGSQWFAELLDPVRGNAESPLELVLGQALIKKDKFEWVIQKAAELGVTSIFPVHTQRSEIHLDEKRVEKKMGRWERILVEAVKQCGRDRVPDLRAPVDLTELIEMERASQKFFFDEQALDALHYHLEEVTTGERVVLLVGPEGGWDSSDREAVLGSSKIHRVKLGPRTLRSETAAVTALSIVQYVLGDLRG